MRKTLVVPLAAVAALFVVLYLVLSGSKDPDSADRTSSPKIEGCVPTDPGESYSKTDVNFPLRPDLPDLPGVSRRITITGYVLNADCSPVESAVVKFWSSREEGAYTDDSFGSAVSDGNGFYKVSTPAPVAYPGRPSHVHLETSVGNQAVFTEIFVEDGGDGYRVDFVPPPITTPPTTPTGTDSQMP